MLGKDGIKTGGITTCVAEVVCTIRCSFWFCFFETKYLGEMSAKKIREGKHLNQLGEKLNQSGGIGWRDIHIIQFKLFGTKRL